MDVYTREGPGGSKRRTRRLGPNRLRKAAERFLDDAFRNLTDLHALPRPDWAPWMKIGEDYFGPDMHSLDSFHTLEEEIEVAFPKRFEKIRGHAKDFGSLYASDLLNAAVFKLARARAPYLAAEPEAQEAIDELVRLLKHQHETATCIRVVGDLIVPDGYVAGPVRVIPHPDGVTHPSISRLIEDLVPEAGYEADELRMATFAKDRALLVVTSDEPISGDDLMHNAFTVAANRNDQSLDRFITAIRLLTNGTTPNLLSVRGIPSLVHRYPPEVGAIPNSKAPWIMLRRPAALGSGTGQRVHRFAELLRYEGLPSPLGLAIGRFNQSYVGTTWWERVVDLAIALEAVFGEPGETSDLTLRLTTRAASLLGSSKESSLQIYEDVKTCYRLRSKLVHGSAMTTKQIEKTIKRVPSTHTAAMPADVTELLVDRFRDIVRRAILVRLALAQLEPVVWSFDDKSMDGWLTDDQERRRLNAEWRRRIRRIGLASTASGAGPMAVDYS